MSNYCLLKRTVLGITVAAATLRGAPATAEPVAISGLLSGDLRFAHVVTELDLQFPGFSVDVPIDNQLTPGFCIDGCGNPIAVPFTQTTGPFAGHSTAFSGGVIDADVTGTLSFTGPAKALPVDPFGGGSVSADTQVSGALRVTQGDLVLFNGLLNGSGTGSAYYETVGVAGTRFAGYQYAFDGVATTPEPAPLWLLGCGAAWLATTRRGRRRRSAGR